MRRLASCAAVLALVVPAGCGEQVCAMPGCRAENLTIELTSSCWPAGSYEVRGTMDGEAFSIVFPRPGGAAVSADGRITVRTSEPGVEELAIVGTPAGVELELLLDGTPIAGATFSGIAYQDRLAGGGDCEPTNCGPGAERRFELDPAQVATLCAWDGGGGAP